MFTSLKSLEKAILKAKHDVIINLAAEHRSKKKKYTFSEELKAMQDCGVVLKKLHEILMEYIEKNVQESDKAKALDWTAIDPKKCKEIGELIHAVTDIFLACIECDLTVKCNTELVRMAVFLSNLLLSMPDSMDNVKNSISLYCEKLYLTGCVQNCECFLKNVLLYLIKRTTSRRLSKVDVKRIYAIRNILRSVLEAKGDISEEMWTLFSKWLVSDAFLSTSEGEKIITMLMTIDQDRLLEMQQIIVSYIPRMNVKMALSYGKIFFDAWSLALRTGNKIIQDSIIYSCLQQYVRMGINSRKKNVLPLIRKILANFIIHKKDYEVARYLLAMYQPIIWLYVKDSDGQRRANAGQLFLDVFPLEDPEIGLVANQSEVNEQLLIIQSLLLDEYPIVRITAILGLCVSMSVNWEVFPEEMLKTYFKILVNQLSRDSASAEVRIAVVKGFMCLLENPLAVRSLVNVFPKMLVLFHDVSEQVRIAFCQFLLKVKKISAIKYFQIVPIEHIFVRMEVDCHAVKKALTNLMHNSYFPKREEPKTWLGRCLELMKSERKASRVFFTYVSCFIGIENSVRFMIELVRAVHFYVKIKSDPTQIDMKLTNRGIVENMNEYVNDLDEAVGFSDLTVVSTVFDAVAVMWLSLKPEADKEENKNWMKMLVAKLNKLLFDLCHYYGDTEAWQSVFYASSFIPPESIPSLASLTYLKLETLSPTADETEYMTILQTLANQLQLPGLLNMIKVSIETGLGSSFVPATAKKKRGRKSKSGNIPPDQLHPYLSCHMLNSMLNERNLQMRLLEYKKPLKQIMNLIAMVKKIIENKDARLDNEEYAQFVKTFTSTVISLSLLLHGVEHPESIASVAFINDFVKWARNELIKPLVKAEPKKNKKDVNDKNSTENKIFTNLVLNICKDLIKVLGDAAALGYVTPINTLHMDFTFKLLRTDYQSQLLLIASRFLFKYAFTGDYMIFIQLQLQGRKIFQMLSVHLNLIYSCINDTVLEEIPEQEIPEIEITLANVMKLVDEHTDKVHSESASLKVFLKHILDSVVTRCDEIVEEMAIDPFDTLKLSKTSNFFLGISTAAPDLIEAYVKYLAEDFKNTCSSTLPMWIACWKLIWHFLHAKDVSESTIKELTKLARNLQDGFKMICSQRKYSIYESEEKSSKPAPMKLFLDHCQEEFTKLKNYVLTDLKTHRKTRAAGQ